MKYTRILDRRTLLKGAGSVVIGLPFLEEMRIQSVYAQAAAPPVRGLNLFFGLGYPMPIQSEGFEGKNSWIKTLEPFEPLKSKLAILRGVNQTLADHADNSHYDGAAAAFTGTKMPNKNTTGGISVDQALRRGGYPQGLPAGMIPAISGGTFFRRSDSTNRYIHSRNQDGSPVEVPKDTPAAFFTRVFGEAPGMTGMPPASDPAAARQQRLRKSVLDTVTAQYKHFMSDAGSLGAPSRARLADHLDRIRELEARIFAADGGPAPKPAACPTPVKPVDPSVPSGTAADPGGQGINITLTDLVGHWQKIADVFALAVKCDRARFGSAVFQGAGERIRLKGNYQYDGRLIYDFDDARDRPGTSGATACSHEYWHSFADAGENRQLRAHLHLMMNQIAHLMKLLDAPDAVEENGKTILENSMVIVSTESGDGRHNDSTRELTGVLHMISGGNGRFKTGQIIDVNNHGIHLYNTMLAAFGVGRTMGDGGGATIDQILL